MGDIPMLFNRIASLRDEQDQRGVIHARNLPRTRRQALSRGKLPDNWEVLGMTNQYTLTIDDSQRIALEAALEFMIEHCKANLATGEGSPYWAGRKSCIEGA